MGTDFEAIEVFKLLVFLFVKFEEFSQKVGVISIDSLTILFEVQNSSRFRLDLVNVEVVDASNFKRSFGFLDRLALFSLACLLYLFSLS
jgi:hypothetical protein